MAKMTKVERLQAAIEGGAVDRPPVALWRHFPGDDQRPEDLAAATIAFQKRYDFDFVKVSPASSFCLKDWGAEDVWMGTLEGTRDYTHHPIQAPEDWQRLAVLGPDQGKLGEMLEALRLIGRGLDADTPFIQTVFSPLSQVKNLVGKENLPVHLRRHPDALHAALEIITETTVRFVEAVCETRVAGVFYAIQQAQYGILNEDEFTAFGRYYDLQVLEAAQDLWLNVLHVHGEDVMFDFVADYPVQVINWHDRDTRPSLAEAQGRFEGALCGGLQRWTDLVRGTPDLVRQRAQDALTQTGGRNFILGTGCVTPVVTPLANIRAAREVFA